MEEYRLVTDISSSLDSKISYSENRHKNVKKSTYLNLIIGCTLSVVLCIVLLIVSILNVMWIHMHDCEQSIKTDSIKDQNDNYYIMLPVHANNGTVVTKTSVPYNKVPTAESTVFLLKLITGYHFLLYNNSTNNERSDDKAQNGYKEERKTLNLLKAGYSYTQTGISPPEKTHSMLKVNDMKNTSGIQIEGDGLYYVYSCLQVACLHRKTSERKIIHYINLNSRKTNKTVIEHTVTIPRGLGVYRTSNILIPLQLHNNDIVSMSVSDSNCIYNSRKSNILGVLKT